MFVVWFSVFLIEQFQKRSSGQNKILCSLISGQTLEPPLPHTFMIICNASKYKSLPLPRCPEGVEDRAVLSVPAPAYPVMKGETTKALRVKMSALVWELTMFQKVHILL